MDPSMDLKYKVIALFLIFFSVVIIIVGIICIHELPYLIAKKRNNPQKDAIRCMAIMGLFILPLWFLAMIWAFMNPINWGLSRQNEKSLKSDPDTKSKANNKRANHIVSNRNCNIKKNISRNRVLKKQKNRVDKQNHKQSMRNGSQS